MRPLKYNTKILHFAVVLATSRIGGNKTGFRVLKRENGGSHMIYFSPFSKKILQQKARVNGQVHWQKLRKHWLVINKPYSLQLQ